MVKKLLKYECIYYIRTLGLFMAILPVLGLMVRIFRLFDPDSVITMLAMGSSAILLYLGALALMVTTMIIGIIRFYKNMYSSEGYLTLTLPVTNRQHIFVKLLAAVIFEVLAFFVILLSALIALSGEPLRTLLTGVKDIVHDVPPIHSVFYLLEGLLLLLVALVSGPLLYYACITIGQAASKNRILMAVGVYFLYYAITQAVSTVLMILFSVFGTLGALEWIWIWISDNGEAFLHIVLVALILIGAALDLLYYRVTLHFMSKKLNLE